MKYIILLIIFLSLISCTSGNPYVSIEIYKQSSDPSAVPQAINITIKQQSKDIPVNTTATIPASTL